MKTLLTSIAVCMFCFLLSAGCMLCCVHYYNNYPTLGFYIYFAATSVLWCIGALMVFVFAVMSNF
jgi:hypothetical protein